MTTQKRCLLNALLFISLAFNLFAVGFLLSHHGEKRQPPYMRLEAQLRDLPDPENSRVAAVLARYHPQIVTQFNVVQNSREALRAEIRSPRYSRAKATKLFDAMQMGYRKMGDATQAMILDVNDELTPEQRMKFDPLPPGPPGEHKSR